MKITTHTLISLFFALTIIGCNDPIERTGTVVDRDTGEPLEGVSIEIHLGFIKRDTLSEKVFTDENGYFHVSQLEDSDKLFEVRKEGYIGFVNALSQPNDTIRLEKMRE